MPTVYVVNKGGHDFKAAERYGDIKYLSVGTVSPFAVDKMYREFAQRLKYSKEDDYILITGLSIMSSIACSCFSHKHNGRLNLLLFRNDKYITRTVMLGRLL